MLQMRPPNSSDTTPKYAPARDIAHLGPKIVRTAMISLDPPNQDGRIRELIKVLKLTNEDVAQGAAVVAALMSEVWKTPDPEVAWIRSGFLDLPPQQFAVVMAQVGCAFMTAYFKGVQQSFDHRDQTPGAVLELGEIPG